jgi:hypothetical protein
MPYVRRPLLLVIAGVVGLPIAIAAGCTTPPDIGYNQAGRITMLPEPTTDATTLTPDGSEAGPSMMMGLCAPGGVICHKDADCCGSNTCTDGVCTGPGTTSGEKACIPDTVVCEQSSDCCDGYCALSGVCGQLPSNTCAPDGVTCEISAADNFPAPGGTCCTPCGAPTDGGKPRGEPCGTCGPKGFCTVVGYPDPPSALCIPLGVICPGGPGSKNLCCAGQCYQSTIGPETVCAIAPP